MKISRIVLQDVLQVIDEVDFENIWLQNFINFFLTYKFFNFFYQLNLLYSCLEFYKFLKRKRELLRQIAGIKKLEVIIVIDDSEFSHNDGDDNDDEFNFIKKLHCKIILFLSFLFKKNSIPRNVQFLDIYPILDPKKDASLM